ncbi:MAG: hypothetical protein OER90_09275 [Gemmatimonadota bacterium]|nr:hypothetical protein [Gemmatimonadota bacterium]
MVRASVDRTFYASWILANGWAEAVGLGTTLVLGWLIGPKIDQATGPVVIVLGAVTAVVLGTLLEGVVVGFAQVGVLRRRLPSIAREAWIVATAIGAGVAWVLGMIPSTLMALTVPAAPAAQPAEPSVLLQYGLALMLGSALGVILGGAQWFVLRRHVARASRWIAANAVAWAVGMTLIFVGMDRVPWDGGAASIVVGIFLVTLLVGAVVGAIHGRVLMHLIGQASTES